MKRKTRHGIILAVLLLILIAIVTIVGLSYMSPSEDDMRKGRAVVTYNVYYSINIDDKECLFFSHQGDSSLVALSADSTFIYRKKIVPACWINKFSLLPSCFGTLLISADSVDYDLEAYNIELSLRPMLKKQYGQMQERLSVLDRYIEEMDYYLSVHNLQDEGYDYIVRCHADLEKKKETLKRTLDIIHDTDSMMNVRDSKVEVKAHEEFVCYYYDNQGELQHEQCTPLMRNVDFSGKAYWVVQMQSETTPEGAVPRSRHRVLPSVNNIYDLYWDQWGVGNGKADSIVICKDPEKYSGQLYKGKKQGKGVITIDDRVIRGVWNNDSLVSGTRIDSLGIYEGSLDIDGKAKGHGAYASYDDNYYEGHWENDCRNVFGFSLSHKYGMRVGEWKEDRYLGEKVRYTTDRIYGIDISKYQHERPVTVTKKVRVRKGRRYRWVNRKQTVTKVYPIDWSKIRITHLGTVNNKRVNGTTDFPVSFVYIKATEGTSIVNKYYSNDYAQAKKNGLKVGSYHFFSTRTRASDQARYFLQYAHIKKGDFPPVLDVEPTADMVRKIGGKQALIRRIKIWLTTVEKWTGVRPILYVSQNFVKKYLEDEEDLKKNYQIWIARYGEYKPDFRLIYWQLCPDGRVSGIQGTVDINVFNGYGAQFDEFKLSRCVEKDCVLR